MMYVHDNIYKHIATRMNSARITDWRVRLGGASTWQERSYLYSVLNCCHNKHDRRRENGGVLSRRPIRPIIVSDDKIAAQQRTYLRFYAHDYISQKQD